MIKADTSGADVLAEKLKGLPAKLQTRISRVILKEALKETGAREELTGYISTHFKAHTGIYRKSGNCQEVHPELFRRANTAPDADRN